ncbi:hypothetical protein INR49_021226 [Caranx melampygus]|nr:hypothetical protein INR49_021226 [Caranx melampygus]
MLQSRRYPQAEQQQQQQAGALELQHRAHTQQQQHLAGSPPQQQQQQQRHFQSPPSCMLDGAREPSFSDGEENWPTSAGGGAGRGPRDTSLSRTCTSTRPAGAKLEAAELGSRRAVM